MYNEDYMYAVDRSDEYLAHYGIKGMRWGVRKAIERGNQRALARHYRRAQKKLAKLERQASGQDRYNKRAARLATGAAIAGGVAGLGTEGISRGLVQAGTYGANGVSAVRRALLGTGASKYAQKVGAAGFNSANALSKWGNQHMKFDNTQSREIRDAYNRVANKYQAKADALKAPIGFSNVADPGKAKMYANQAANVRKTGAATAEKHMTQVPWNNNQLLRAGSAAIGAGLLGAAAYNKYRASHTDKAAAKAKQFRAEMNKAFKGTQYANNPSPKKKVRRRR